LHLGSTNYKSLLNIFTVIMLRHVAVLLNYYFCLSIILCLYSTKCIVINTYSSAQNNNVAMVLCSVLEITVGNRTLSSQILQMSGQLCIMIENNDRTTLQLSSTAWVIFFKVLSFSKLCPVQFVKCLTKRKIWKDIIEGLWAKTS